MPASPHETTRPSLDSDSLYWATVSRSVDNIQLWFTSDTLYDEPSNVQLGLRTCGVGAYFLTRGTAINFSARPMHQVINRFSTTLTFHKTQFKFRFILNNVHSPRSMSCITLSSQDIQHYPKRRCLLRICRPFRNNDFGDNVE